MPVIRTASSVLAVLLAVSACERRDAQSTAASPSLSSSLAPSAPNVPTRPAPSDAASSANSETSAPSALASAEPTPTRWRDFEPVKAETDFCTDRVRVLDVDACFALPEAVTRELLIYLHGIVPPTKESPQKTNFERVVADASERANVAALIPRGKQGLAPKAYPGWWGWPTTPASYRSEGVEHVEKLRAKRRQLEQLVGVEFERIYLAGSSSGAYFVVAIALFGGMPEVDGFGMMSGGSGYKTSEFEALAKRPVYIGFGKSDSVAPGARALGQMLEAAGWPVQIAAHPLPHGAREIYLDEAFRFWREPPD